MTPYRSDDDTRVARARELDEEDHEPSVVPSSENTTKLASEIASLREENHALRVALETSRRDLNARGNAQRRELGRADAQGRELVRRASPDAGEKAGLIVGSAALALFFGLLLLFVVLLSSKGP